MLLFWLLLHTTAYVNLDVGLDCSSVCRVEAAAVPWCPAWLLKETLPLFALSSPSSAAAAAAAEVPLRLALIVAAV